MPLHRSQRPVVRASHRPRMQLSVECKNGPIGIDLERIKEMLYESIPTMLDQGALTLTMRDESKLLFVGAVPEVMDIAQQINHQVKRHSILRAPNVQYSVLPHITVSMTDRH